MRLPREQQPIGIAAFGVTAVMGPVMGPLVGGWLTENVSWHYAFFLNLPVCIALLMLLILACRMRKAIWANLPMPTGLALPDWRWGWAV
jgi:DHA2 family multidrug resistance protein